MREKAKSCKGYLECNAMIWNGLVMLDQDWSITELVEPYFEKNAKLLLEYR